MSEPTNYHKLQCFSVFDKTTFEYNQPFFAKSDFEAMRHIFHIGASDSNHLVSCYPHHFKVCRVASFSPTTGTFTPEPFPVLVGEVSEFDKFLKDLIPVASAAAIDDSVAA